MNKDTPESVLEDVLEDGEHWSNHAPHCPHCGHCHDDFGDAWQFKEGGFDTKCESCGKEFNVDLYISHSWTTTKGSDYAFDTDATEELAALLRALEGKEK